MLVIASITSHENQLWGQTTSAEFASLVERLDDNVFQARRDAANDLVDAATGDSDSEAAKVIDALRRGLHHRSFEVRIASRDTLRRITQVRYDQQVAHLRDPYRSAKSVRLAGWAVFRRAVGEDMTAREMFVEMCDRFPNEIRQIDRETRAASIEADVNAIDPFALSQDDAVSWSVVLLVDLQQRIAHRPGAIGRSKQTQRIGSALANSAIAPSVSYEPQSMVLQRMIRRWIRHRGSSCARYDRLLGAMRFGCKETAIGICEEVFADADAPPATIATALLCASVLGSDEVRLQVKRRLDDDRVAHVWELVASRHTKIRTEVRDVALALMLHRRGMDPREAGFRELQADPLLVFRPQSLGFPNQTARQRARKTALDFLATQPTR